MISLSAAIAGGRYCSADHSSEFQTIISTEFAYDITITAFDIELELQSPCYQMIKGYGSPEVRSILPGLCVLRPF